MKLTPKQEKFCQKYIELSSASEAYREVYDAENMKPETIHVKACELKSNGKVAERIKELQNMAVERHLCDIYDLIEELEEARTLARDLQQPSAMVSASVGKGKLLGLGKETIDITSSDKSLRPTEIVFIGLDDDDSEEES